MGQVYGHGGLPSKVDEDAEPVVAVDVEVVAASTYGEGARAELVERGNG